MERLDEWVNMGRGRMRGCPPGLTRYGEDDARDYIELDREEHRFQVEYNGRGFEPSFAGLSHRLSGAMIGLITAALRNLFEPAAPLLPPLLPHPPLRPPFGWGRSRRREHLYRQSSWFDPEFGSANYRSNYSARSEHRYHRDNDDGYFDVDTDSTTFFDPYDMPLGPPRVRFA
ncbi:hypothetical protein MY4038_002791 [Beauveria bassiana]|uniref:Uncharacterized protein n=1 Tax=Beauveria bassiana TaxID=176275 RepID=A0A2N6NKI3_BEABA|nr:hypothetical protein BM221_005950 [Beauveria bassiana]